MKTDYFGMVAEYQQQTAKAKPKRKPRVEAKIQQALVHMCEMHIGRYPDLELLHSVPNESYFPSKKNESTGEWFSYGGQMLNKLGRKKGVWDLSLPVSRGGFIGMVLETKAPGGRLTPEQTQWGELLFSRGHYCVIYDDWEIGWQRIVAYLESQILRSIVQGVQDCRGSKQR